VLSCTIFAVSSGCSENSNKDTVESSKVNITQGDAENSKVNITQDDAESGKVNINQDDAENSEGSASADKVEDSGEALTKAPEKETNVIIESTGSSGEKVETEIVSTGNSGDWCPVGSSWKTVDPQTNEEMEMKVTGIETIDGIPMCKAVYEINNKDEDVSKVEYLWSQDGKTYFWTSFDASGKKVSEVSMKEGKMRMVDKDGKVMEITTDGS
jgi:hypothetical protein